MERLRGLSGFLLFAGLFATGLGLYVFGASAVTAQDPTSEETVAVQIPVPSASDTREALFHPSPRVIDAAASAAAEDGLELVQKSPYARYLPPGALWTIVDASIEQERVAFIVRTESAFNLDAAAFPYVEVIVGEGAARPVTLSDDDSCRPSATLGGADDVLETRKYPQTAENVNALLIRVDLSTSCVLSIALAPIAPPGHPDEALLNTSAMTAGTPDGLPLPSIYDGE